VLTARYNFQIKQAAAFQRKIKWKDGDGEPVDLTGYKALMHVRVQPSRELVLKLSSESGGIELGGEEGTIEIFISSDETEKLKSREYRYDLLMIPEDGKNIRLLEGNFSVDPAVTLP